MGMTAVGVSREHEAMKFWEICTGAKQAIRQRKGPGIIKGYLSVLSAMLLTTSSKAMAKRISDAAKIIREEAGMPPVINSFAITERAWLKGPGDTRTAVTITALPKRGADKYAVSERGAASKSVPASQLEKMLRCHEPQNSA